MYLRLAICMPYHENPVMLGTQYANWIRWPRYTRERCEFRICDDASPTAPARFPEHFIHGFDLRLFRIRPPHVRWSHRCATNIAAHHTTADWLLLTDIDHLIPLSTVEHILVAAVDPATVYTFRRTNVRGEPVKHHPDSWLIHRDTWKVLGGWDERYRGLYGVNADIWRKVRYFVGEPVELPVHIISVGRDDVPDASCDLEKKTRKLSDKEKIKRLRAQFRFQGTFFDSHQLTVPYDEVKP